MSKTIISPERSRQHTVPLCFHSATMKGYNSCVQIIVPHMLKQLWAQQKEKCDTVRLQHLVSEAVFIQTSLTSQKVKLLNISEKKKFYFTSYGVYKNKNIICCGSALIK